MSPSQTRQSPMYRDKAAYNRPYKVKGKTYYPMASARGYSEQGIASWYGHESGNRTAMGTRFKPQGLTAAHKTLPLPSKVRVTNLHNGRSVVVMVNDRGPFRKNRLIDLSHGAAKQIGVRGLAKVKVEFLESRASRTD
ncbi:MAG: septal ring lytic transglycosylase RlpA family protein [Methylobacter sp.]